MKNEQEHLRENLLEQGLTFLLAFHVEWGETQRGFGFKCIPK